MVEIPADHRGPLRVQLRRGPQTIADLTCQVPDEVLVDEPAVAQPAAEDTQSLSEQRRRQIYDAACDVIARKGLAATSMRDIAKASDVSIGTMYRYIGTKDDLLYRITKDCMQELFEYFEVKLTGKGSAADRMAEAISTYLSYISEHHRYINLVYRETKALADEPRARIYDIERNFMALWAQIIRDGIDAGEFVDVDVDLAANISYFACTVWALRFWSIGDRSQHEVEQLLVRMIVNGLRAP